MPQCPQCSAKVQLTDTQCMECGKLLLPPKPPPPPPHPTPAQPTTHQPPIPVWEPAARSAIADATVSVDRAQRADGILSRTADAVAWCSVIVSGLVVIGSIIACGPSGRYDPLLVIVPLAVIQGLSGYYVSAIIATHAAHHASQAAQTRLLMQVLMRLHGDR